jgi:hypothetical protein
MLRLLLHKGQSTEQWSKDVKSKVMPSKSASFPVPICRPINPVTESSLSLQMKYGGCGDEKA